MRTFAVLSCCAATLLTAPARAQDAEVAALIERGVGLRERGDDDAALALFTEAWERAPTPRARAQMALAEQAMGRWVLAYQHLREVLVAGADPWIQRRHAHLVESLREVAAHVGSLEVRGNVVGAEVWLDGERIARLPMSEPSAMVVGDGVVEVRATGYSPVRRPVTIRAGALTRETFTLDPSGPREPPPPREPTRIPPVAPPPPAPGPTHGSAWASLGGAALFVGTAIGAWIAREGAAEDYNSDARCDRDGDSGRATARDSECPGERSTVHALTGVTIGGAVVGGALGVVAAMLFTRGPATAPTRTGLCGPGPGALGLSCAVHF